MVSDEHKLKELRKEARRLRERSDWGEKAIEVNTKIFELDSRDVAALNRRARCHREQGDIFAAKEDYNYALALSPENPNIKRALEEIDVEIQKQCEYERFIEEIRSLKHFAKAYEIGKTYKHRDSVQRQVAIEAFKQAFKLDRTRLDVLIELAAVHRTLRQRDEAEMIYCWILRRRESSVAKVGLAAIYKDKKRLKDAMKLCDEVLAKEPYNAYALRCRAGILSELDRGTEAVSYFSKSYGFDANELKNR